MTHIIVGLVVLLAVGLVGLAPAAAPPKRVPVLGVLLSGFPPAEPEGRPHAVFVPALRALDVHFVNPSPVFCLDKTRR